MSQQQVPEGIAFSSAILGMSYSIPDHTPGIHSHTWILDSGATSHIAHSLAIFNSHIPLVDRFVILPNKSKVQVMAIGSVYLNKDILLRDVLYIPSFTVNLISVSALIHSNSCDVKFTSAGFLIQEPNQLREIGKGDLYAGLYLFHEPLCKPSNNAHLNFPVLSNVHVSDSVVSSVLSNDERWHARFGHPSDEILHLLNKNDLISLSSKYNSHDCTVCPVSKFKRLSFTSNNHFSDNPFDLIH